MPCLVSARWKAVAISPSAHAFANTNLGQSAAAQLFTITNNGDGNDSDETMYVTEYFAQTRTDTLPADDSRFDVERRGLVYRVGVDGTTHGYVTSANFGYSVGASIAYALSKRGASVTMIDRDEPGRGASYGNSGALSPASATDRGHTGRA